MDEARRLRQEAQMRLAEELRPLTGKCVAVADDKVIAVADDFTGLIQSLRDGHLVADYILRVPEADIDY